MRKKLGVERGYLAVEDLQIKSKFPRSSMPIREVRRSGESNNARGRRKKRKKPRSGKVGADFKQHLGAIDLGAKLGVNVRDVKLGAKIYYAEVATSHRHVCVDAYMAPRPRLASRCVSSA